MKGTSWPYRMAVRLALSLTPAISRLNSRMRAGVRARRTAGERLLDWSRSSRDDAHPLIWFHAASVGEGLQAESVLQHLRRLRPDCQAIYTHFSPSAEALAARLPVDVADYLPYDLPGNVERLLSALRPDLLVFSKLDVWPELSTRASNRGSDVAIVAATVSPGSSRLLWPARTLLQPGYRAVSAAAAISSEDATRLARLGVAPERIQVLGDPRFDSVMEKVRAVRSDEPLLRFGRGAPTMVAGSTWQADDSVLLSAFAAVRQLHPEARLILVPHEPTEVHLESILRRAAAAGLPAPERLSTADGPAPLVVVDRVGVLATLYGAGTMAYVGGGFGRAGLHSVLEPAAWGVPVTFGPRWKNSRDAAQLLAGGGGTALRRSDVRGAASALELQWNSWISDAAGRVGQGERARSVVEGGLGASEKSAIMLAELISSRLPRTSPTGARSGRQSVP